MYFNSRPHEEVDQGITLAGMFFDISTHDLTKRSTMSQMRQTRQKKHFNSRPHEEVDGAGGWIFAGWPCNFNSRPHEEVDGSYCAIKPPVKYFNSRPHEEVDSQCVNLPYVILQFQLTTSRRGRPADTIESLSAKLFQLTTSRRGRLVGTLRTWCIPAHFNSRPHEEVDRKLRKPYAFVYNFNSRPHEEVDVSFGKL